MKKIKLFPIFFSLCALLVGLWLPFSASAAEPRTMEEAKTAMQNAMSYGGMSMRLSGNTSGIRSLWIVNHKTVTELEAEGYTVTYGAIMGVAKTGNTELRTDASDLSVAFDENLGYKIASGVKSAAVCVVYATNNPSYASNLYIAESGDTKSFAYTTTFGGKQETPAYYTVKMTYRAFFALEKDGVTEIGYVEMAPEKLEQTVSLTDIADYFYNDYEGANAASYKLNRMVLRVYAPVGTSVSVENPNGVTGQYDLIDTGTYKVTADKTLPLVIQAPATGFYAIKAKLNSEGAQVRTITAKREKIGSFSSYTTNWRIGPDNATANGDTSADAYKTTDTDNTSEEILCYTYLIGGNTNTLSWKPNVTVGISDISIELADLPITESDSILLYARSSDAIKTEGVSNKPPTGVQFASANTISFNVTPVRTAVYSVGIMAALKNCVPILTATADDVEAQAVSTDVAKSSLYPTGSSSSVGYIPMSGGLRLYAGKTYTLTLSLDGATGTVQDLDYILLQAVESFDPAKENTVRVNLWESAAEMTTTGEKLGDNKTIFLNRKAVTFKVNAIREGLYGIRMLENHYNANRIDFITTTDKEGSSIQYLSRTAIVKEVTGAFNAETGNKNEMIVDQSKLKAEMTGDYYGYVYLHKGVNTVTVTNSGVPLGIAAVELTLHAPYTPNSADIRILAMNGGTVSEGGSATLNKTNKIFQLTSGSVTWSFTVTEAGNYDLYAYVGAKGPNTSTPAKVGMTVNGVTDTTFEKYFEYTHNHQFLSAGNSSTGATSVKFPDSVFLEAGDYTVTWAAVSGHGQNNLIDIRLIAQDRPVFVPAAEATCKDGNIAYYYQVSTGKYFSDADGKNEITYEDTVVAGNGEHAFGEWSPVVDATCDTKGLTQRVCNECGEKEAEFIKPYGHEYSSWTVDQAPTLTATGLISRTCTSTHHTGSGTVTEVLPTLGTNNGYKLHDDYTDPTTGEDLDFDLPTFTSAGEAYFSIRKTNQMFIFHTELPSLTDYYAGRTDAYIVSASDMTYTEGVTYNEAYNALVFPKLPGGSEAPTHEAAFSVTVEKEGFYSLHLKYANQGKKDQTRMYVYNDSLSGFTSRFKTLLPQGTASMMADEATYLPRLSYTNKDFDDTETMTVYLQKGVNNLRIAFTAVNSSHQVGISKLLLLEKTVFDENDTKDVYLYNAGNKEGFRIEEGTSGSYVKKASVSLTAPTSGSYKIYAMMSTSGGQMVLSSPANSFPTVYTAIAALQSGNSNADYKKTTHLYEMGTLQLTEGTHTVDITMKDIASTWLHFNLLVAVRVGDMEPEKSLTVNLDRVLNENTHVVTVTADISGTVPATGSANMKLVFSGYYTNEDGTETPFSTTLNKTAYTDTFTLSTDPLTANIKDAVLFGTDGVTYQLSVYDEGGENLLYRSELKHYTLRDTLRVYMLADLHYTGSNINQALWRDDKEDYSYMSLKSYDTYRTSYEAYGWSSDEKEQRVMDDIIQRYKAGEFDILFLLGDQSTNDGNYQNYAQDSVAWKEYGDMDDFIDSPLNKNYMMEELFLNQLAEYGIPYYAINGKHDYGFYYNDTKTDLVYPYWEAEYHYEELFGHKTTDGVIYDATPVDFVVRAIRRNGEIKILSALSTEELAAFKLRNAGDGHNYDFYVSDDSLTDSDVLLGAFVVINPQQFDSFEYYMKYYVYRLDPDTGEIVERVHYDSHGQSIRTDYLYDDLYPEFDALIEDYECVYLMGHNSADTIRTLSKFLERNENIKGFFMGDVHTEETDTRFGILPRWVAGCFSSSYDIDIYFERDPETGELTTVKDAQYFHSDNANREAYNQTEGDYTQHPFAGAMLYIRGGESYVERSRMSFFYDNYQPQYKLGADRVTGWDPGYVRAVDYTHEAGTTFTVGNRTVYVGGDANIVGSTHLQLASSYVKGKYNAAEYVLAPTGTALVYTLCDTAARPLDASGAVAEISGNAAVTVTLSSTDEGATVSIGGTTYYIVSKSGGMVGHYLYDENGDFVYLDKNGNYVFYNFVKDNGTYVVDYFYETKDNQYIYIGTMGADGLLRDENGELVTWINKSAETPDPEDPEYEIKLILMNSLTENDIWLSGDQVKVAYLDDTESSAHLFEKVTKQFGGKFRVKTARITIINGVIVRGEPFLGYGYKYNFVDANGNTVDKADVLVRTQTSYTYKLSLEKVKAAAVKYGLADYANITALPYGKELYTMYNKLSAKVDFETLYDIKVTENDPVVGFYVPHMLFETNWIRK